MMYAHQLATYLKNLHKDVSFGRTFWKQNFLNQLQYQWASPIYTIIKDMLIFIPMKPYIKGQYWMITTIPLDDNYFLVVIIQWENFKG